MVARSELMEEGCRPCGPLEVNAEAEALAVKGGEQEDFFF